MNSWEVGDALLDLQLDIGWSNAAMDSLAYDFVMDHILNTDETRSSFLEFVRRTIAQAKEK